MTIRSHLTYNLWKFTCMWHIIQLSPKPHPLPTLMAPATCDGFLLHCIMSIPRRHICITAGAVLHQAMHAMDIGLPRSSKEALEFLMDNNLSCNSCVLGFRSQYTITNLAPVPCSTYYFKFSPNAVKRSLSLSRIKIISVLRKPALK